MSDLDAPSLWNYVTAEQAENLREKRRAVEQLANEVDRIAAKLRDVDHELTRAALRPAVDHDAAAARLLGERSDTAKPPPSVTSTDELRSGLLGLQNRRAQAEQDVRRAVASYRETFAETVEAAANTAAADYVQAARKLKETWSAILGGHTALEGMRRLIPDQVWGRLHIPGTDEKALHSIGKETQSTFMHGPVIFSGSEALGRGDHVHAMRRLAAHAKQAIGDWPFNK